MDSFGKAALRQFVDSLPEPDRSVIEGIYYEQVGLGTLAKRLGRSKRAVSRIRDRATRTLRLCMETLDDTTTTD